MPVRLVAGRYELRELLGEGGMGVVYRAVDTRTGGMVAIKTMRDISDPRTVEMFKKEWHVLSRLSHPNIVDIRDVDEIEEDGVRKPCFIMPLLPGITLAALIKDSSRRLTVEKIVGMLCQVCNGLEAAHKSGLIHRDLKPSNIFIMEDDTAKIIDFGLVYSADAHSVTGYKGTWQYMAPEQTEGKTPTVWSDIFSLGVVAYEAFTGRKPFARSSVEATIDAIRTGIPPAISEINPKVSQLLSKVVHKAIAKQPMHRYASAREFSETLQKAYQNQPIERFETARILPRIERARNAFAKDDPAFASEILTELEAEGNVDPEITLLRAQIEEAVKQKRIRQLFEGAQTRIEQDEIPLALDKLREILELDPGNNEALAMRRRIEEQRNTQQISDWMRLARQHLQLQDFGEARQALKEVFKIRYDESEALQLQAEIDVQEKEAVKARAEKEQLYGSALRAYQGGEISTALSKLEKILEVSRRTPGAAIPERDAVYQSFYNRVRSERDSIDKAYEDGRRFLNEKEFQKAVEICDQMLAQYPKSAQFQALKLKVEQSERQELSAYIAEVAKSADAEPDLDRRVNIFEEACGRYPAEAQFQQSLRLSREQRDLVHSISAKARQYEEQSQFADAIGQWKILRNIHPQYPGIEVEIGQLERRREQQIQEEKKARFVELIDRAIDNASYAKALQLAIEALAEFPQDSELIVLERIARQGMERTQEAERLFEEARQMRAGGQLEDATGLLQQAFELDKRNLGMRNTLVSLLVERAHSLLDKDWRTAEPLAEEALALDEHHPAAKRLRKLISEAKRKDCVRQCVAEVRELQSAGDVHAALSRLGSGLSQYPDEPRLLQYQASLENLSQQHQKRQRFSSSNNDPRPSEPRKEALPAAAETSAPTPAPVETGFTTIFNQSDGIDNSIPNSIGATRVVIPQTSKSVPEAVNNTAAGTPVAPTPAGPSAFALQLQALGRVAASAADRLRTQAVKAGRSKVWAIGLAALVLLCIMAAFLLRRRNPPPPPPAHKGSVESKVDVPVTVVPEGATLALGGTVQSGRTLHLQTGKTYTAAVSKLGYKPLTRSGLTAAGGDWKFVLEPEPVHLQVLTSERKGTVLLDGKDIWHFEQGDLVDFPLSADAGQHTLIASNQTGELFNVRFSTAPGQSPRIASLNTPQLIAASTLGNEANVLTGNPAKSWLNLPGKAPVELNREGTKVQFEATDGDQTTLTISDAKKQRNFLMAHGNAPTLLVALNANPNLGSATITTPVQNAILLVDGRERKTKKPGYWHFAGNPGAHEIRLVADGYADASRTIQIAKGQDTNQEIDMAPASCVFSIEGGIAGAEILIDNALVGTLDSSGSLRTSVAPGQHQVSVRKAGFEGVVLKRTFEIGRPLTLMGRDIVLRPFGTLNFSIEPAGAEVEYRRADETEWHAASAASPLKIRAGIYEVSAKAAGYEPAKQQINLAPGEVAQVGLQLNAVATPKPPVADRLTASFFVHPEELQAQPRNWYTGKSNHFLELKPANKYAFTFLEPDMMPTKHKPKRLEWRIVIDPNTEVSYELDSQQLTRKVKADARIVKSSNRVNASDGQSAYSLVLTVEPHGIKIAKRDGSVLDEFADNRFDWSRATIAIKGDAFFVVR